LAERGFYVREMNSGWHEWQKDGLPTEKGAPPFPAR
jgi:3-mercaptopyruvate sulfurtransferase SseA